MRRSYSRYTLAIRSAGIGGLRVPSDSSYAAAETRRFFAHSISVARSPTGRKRYGRGSTRAMFTSITALDGRICPGGPPFACSWPSAAAWNVWARTPVAPSAANRPRISPAALSVNVTARIWSARNAPLRTWFAMRRVIVVVFPEPAPARMQTGPRTASTARRCSGFRLAKTAS